MRATAAAATVPRRRRRARVGVAVGLSAVLTVGARPAAQDAARDPWLSLHVLVARAELVPHVIGDAEAEALARYAQSVPTGDPMRDELDARRVRAAARSILAGRVGVADEVAANLDYTLALEAYAAGRDETMSEILSASLAIRPRTSWWAIDAYRAEQAAECLRRLGRFGEAIRVLDQAAQLASERRERLEQYVPETAPNRAWKAARVAELDRIAVRAELGRAWLWTSLGRLEDAASRAQAARRAVATVDDAGLRLEVDKLAIDLALALGRNDRVERLATRALAREAVPPETRAQLFVMLGKARSNLLRFDAAFEAFDAAVAVAGATATERVRAELLRAEASLRLGDDLAAARLLIEIEPRLANGSFDLIVEHAALRARVAASSPLEADERRAALAHGRGIYREVLRGVDAVDTATGFLHEQRRKDLLGALITLLVDDGDVDGAFELVLEAHAVGALADRVDSPIPRLASVRRDVLAGDDHGLLVYVPDAWATWVFAVDDEQLSVERVDWNYRWLRRTTLPFLNALLADPRRVDRDAAARAEAVAELDDRGQELAKALLPTAIRDRIEAWQRVTVAGSELFYGLPFEALPWRDGRLLGLAKAVDSCPSLSWAVGRANVRLDEDRARSRLLLAGTLAAPPSSSAGADASGAGTGKGAVTLGADPVGGWAPSYARADVRTLLGAACTREALLGVDWATAVLVHVIAHGDFDPRRARGSALSVLPTPGATDGRIWCADVEQLDVRGVVVLSACGSARGAVASSYDRAGDLGGAFLLAGARAVVLSRAVVRYDRSRAWSVRLHDRLCVGDGLAEAARAARVAAAGDDRWAAYRLAQMQVVGLGQRPVFSLPR